MPAMPDVRNLYQWRMQQLFLEGANGGSLPMSPPTLKYECRVQEALPHQVKGWVLFTRSFLTIADACARCYVSPVVLY